MGQGTAKGYLSKHVGKAGSVTHTRPAAAISLEKVLAGSRSRVASSANCVPPLEKKRQARRKGRPLVRQRTHCQHMFSGSASASDIARFSHHISNGTERTGRS